MADHVRKQIRAAAVTALVGAGTNVWTNHVFPSRTHELQDGELPALRVYTNGGDSRPEEMGVKRARLRHLDLVVECCSKKSSGMDDELDAMIKEAEIALDAIGAIPAAKTVEPVREELEMEGEGEKERGVARLTFRVEYHTQRGAPDVAL